VPTVAHCKRTINTSDDCCTGTLSVPGIVRYGQIPEWVYALSRTGAISHQAGYLYGWLMLRYSQLPGIFPAHRTIAVEMGMSVATVRRLLGQLRDAGAIDWRACYRPDGGRTSSAYVLAWIAPYAYGDDWPPRSPEGDPSVTGNTPPRSPVSDPPRSPVSDQEIDRERRRQRKRGGASVISTLTSADGQDQIPPARCPDHIHAQGPVPPCRACADARRAHDAAVQARDRARAARDAALTRQRQADLRAAHAAAQRDTWVPPGGWKAFFRQLSEGPEDPSDQSLGIASTT
jgi:hypothetical protein